MSDTKLYVPESFRKIEALIAAEDAVQKSWEREPVTPHRQWLGDPRNEVSTGGEGGEGGDGGTTTTTDAGGEGGGAPDLGKLMEAFNGFRTDITTKFDGLASRIPEYTDDENDDENENAGGEHERSPDFFDPTRFNAEDFDEHGQIKREAQVRELGAIVERQVAQALAPDRQAQADRDRTERANALEQKYPIFADEAKRQPILREAQAKAARMARAAGNPALRDAWRDPDFLELTHLGMVGQQALAGETVAGAGGGQEVTLERGGSAGPAGGGDDAGKGIAQSIVKLAGKSKYRLGS